MKQHSPSPLRLALLMGLALLCVFAGAAGALAQEGMTHVKAKAFGKHTRPAALFVHDAHNDKAGIDDCAACHHGKDEQGRQDKEDMSAGAPCAECHALKPEQGTPLMRAYHQQCINCHIQEGKGPSHCAGCHKKE